MRIPSLLRSSSSVSHRSARSQAAQGVRAVHQEGRGLAQGPGSGARRQLPQADAAAEGGDPCAVPEAEAHRGRRRGRTAADHHPRSWLLHGGAGEGRGRRRRPVPDRGPALQLRGSGPVHLQQRRRHPPRTHHQGGLGVAQVGDGGGGSHPPEVRHAGDPGLPPDCGAPGQEDGEGGGGQDAPRGLSVCVEEQAALLQPRSRSGVENSSWQRCPALGVGVRAIEGAWRRSHGAL